MYDASGLATKDTNGDIIHRSIPLEGGVGFLGLGPITRGRIQVCLDGARLDIVDRVLRHRPPLWTSLRRDVPLHRGGFSAAFRDFVNDFA